MGSLLTPEHYAKGFTFELVESDFIHNGEVDWAAYSEAMAQFTYLNMENFMDVKDRYGVVKPFRLNKVQKMMARKKLEQLRKYGYCRIQSLKVRQCGSTKFWSSDLVINAKLRNFGCSIVAHKKESTGEKSIFKYVSSAQKKWQTLEEMGKLPRGFSDVSLMSKSYIEFASGGKIQLVAANLGAVGDTNQYILISEASRIQGYADFWESITPSLPKGNHTTCIVESTARYTGPEFFNDWKEQWDYEKETGEIPMPRSIFIPAYMVEEYCNQPMPDGYDWEQFWKVRKNLKNKRIDPDDLYGPEELLVEKEWYDYYDETSAKLPLAFWYWRRLTIDEQKNELGSGFKKVHWFNQNYPMTPEEAELIAGDSVFPRQELQKRKLMIEVPTFMGDISYDEKARKIVKDPNARRFNYQEWDLPHKGLSYYLFLDPANEKQGDYWAALVYSPMQRLFPAMLRMNNATTQEVLCRLVAMGIYWNMAMIGWEANLVKISDTILLKLLGKDYVNPPGTPYLNLYKRARFDSKKKKKVLDNPQYGFWMADNKTSLIELWMDAIFNDKFKIYQKEVLDELWFMHQNINREGFLKRSPSAPKGKNDDLIVAGGGAMYMPRELPDRWDLLKQNAQVRLINASDPYERYVRSFTNQKKMSGRDASPVAKGYGAKSKFKY